MHRQSRAILSCEPLQKTCVLGKHVYSASTQEKRDYGKSLSSSEPDETGTVVSQVLVIYALNADLVRDERTYR